MIEKVILVDTKDEQVGIMEKMEAHRKGLLHRAFSVFVLNYKGEFLLQRRALDKYHSPGLWTNTCCSHPRPGEDIVKAAERRLMEEMGLKCELVRGFDFIYKASFSNGLTEHEFDHVFFGWCDNVPHINTKEVADWKYVPLKALEEDIAQNPGAYTEWFKVCVEKILDEIEKRKQL